MLICTGRDLEQQELFLKLNKYFSLGTSWTNWNWKLVIYDKIFLRSDFIKSVKSFTGTATEPIESLKLECNPSALKKKIIKHKSYLSENRTFERQEFSLSYIPNDTMTDENSNQNLPSTCQIPSAKSNLATVANKFLFAPISD